MAHPDSFKPLFNRHLLREAVTQHPVTLDEEQRKLALNWAASASGQALLGQKEKPLQGQFLGEVFDRLLGYRQIVGTQDSHNLEPETSSKSVKGYNPPDARLGWFGAGLDRTRVVLELKAPGADLDAKQGAAYGKLTPVEQAFGYAAKVDGCRWVVLSNFLELRLYRTERGQGYCQRFELAELADPDRLAEFVSRHWHHRERSGAQPASQSLQQASVRAWTIIDWLPARMTALSFAVVGSFEEAIEGWRFHAQRFPNDNDGVVLAATAGAINVRLGGEALRARADLQTPQGLEIEADMGDSDSTPGREPEVGHLRSVVGLVWRSVVVWMLLLALLTLARLLG